MPARKRTPTPALKAKVIILTIEYRCDPEYLNTEEILEQMRSSGNARIVNVCVEEGDV